MSASLVVNGDTDSVVPAFYIFYCFDQTPHLIIKHRKQASITQALWLVVFLNWKVLPHNCITLPQIFFFKYLSFDCSWLFTFLHFLLIFSVHIICHEFVFCYFLFRCLAQPGQTALCFQWLIDHSCMGTLINICWINKWMILLNTY